MSLNNTLLESQIQKKRFFNKEKKVFTSNEKNYTKLKSINTIFKNIASNTQYSEVRKRYKLNLIISKILLPKHMHYVLYAFYRKDKLTIAVQNHIGQSELNMQKLVLIKFLKTVEEYKNIKNVSIFRDEKFNKKDSIICNNKQNKYDERSYGIFKNNFKDTRLYGIVEEIRKIIVPINKN